MFISRPNVRNASFNLSTNRSPILIPIFTFTGLLHQAASPRAPPYEAANTGKCTMAVERLNKGPLFLSLHYLQGRPSDIDIIAKREKRYFSFVLSLRQRNFGTIQFLWHRLKNNSLNHGVPSANSSKWLMFRTPWNFLNAHV